MKFIEITKENWETAIELKILPEQEKYLRHEVVLHSLAKCYLMPGKYIPYMIMEKNEPVGHFRFRTYIRGVNIVSFFIDYKHQGKGLGKKAMEYFKIWTREHHPIATEIELWVVPSNQKARMLYEKLGFIYTGETDKG